MTRTYYIALNGLDLGQALDGLRMRTEAWEKTAAYFRNGCLPEEEPFLIEDCNGAEEAERIAEHYRSITDAICRQRDAQDKVLGRQDEVCLPPKRGKRHGYCIYVDSVVDGPIPVERGLEGKPVVYTTLAAAEREIADLAIKRLHEVLVGARALEEAIPLEDFVVEVDLMPDGSIRDEWGRAFPKRSW